MKSVIIIAQWGLRKNDTYIWFAIRWATSCLAKSCREFKQESSKPDKDNEYLLKLTQSIEFQTELLMALQKSDEFSCKLEQLEAK